MDPSDPKHRRHRRTQHVTDRSIELRARTASFKWQVSPLLLYSLPWHRARTEPSRKVSCQSASCRATLFVGSREKCFAFRSRSVDGTECRQTSRALPYGFPIAAEGNTNATGKYDSTATPLYVAGVKVHPLTALVAAPDNTPKPFNTRSLTNLPSVPTVRITTTVPDVTVFAGNAAKVAEFTCAGRKSPFDRSKPCGGVAVPFAIPAPPGLNGLKTTFTSTTPATGTPSSIAGKYFQFFTAFVAASVSGGVSVTICTFCTPPPAPTLTSSVTIPVIDVFTGYGISPPLAIPAPLYFPPVCPNTAPLVTKIVAAAATLHLFLIYSPLALVAPQAGSLHTGVLAPCSQPSPL